MNKKDNKTKIPVNPVKKNHDLQMDLFFSLEPEQKNKKIEPNRFKEISIW